MRDAIAIDFDGCLCVNAYPGIGAPNWAVIAKAKERQTAGAGLILWTCREGTLLQAAVDACRVEHDVSAETFQRLKEHFSSL